MDQILDLDAAPPYVEVYAHAPLMYMSLSNQRRGCAAVPPRQLLLWWHDVQCRIDGVASSLGLYKIKVTGQHGSSCLFSISPDMPAKQQADVMLAAAQQLKGVLAQVLLPDGCALASQITIHAGQYAGGVIGRGAWTYDLFGEEVQAVLDMDAANAPNAIQVSSSALALLSNPMQFTPAAKVVAGGREVALYRWEAASELPTAGLRGGSKAAALAPASLQLQLPAEPSRSTAAVPPTPHKQQLQQQPADAAPSCTQQQQQQQQSGLLFPDRALEAEFVLSQACQLARTDMCFAAISLLLTAVHLWVAAGSAPPSAAQLLVTCGQWLVPLVAVAWYLASPGSYARWREPLWVVHKVAAALHLGGMLALAALQQQQQLAAGSSAAAAAAAAVGAATGGGGGVLSARLAALLRREAVTMLVDNVGFKVRFKVQLLTASLSAAAATLGIVAQWAASGGAASLPLGDLSLRLALGCAAPTLLVYCWEREERGWFLGGGHKRGPAPPARALLRCKQQGQLKVKDV